LQTRRLNVFVPRLGDGLTDIPRCARALYVALDAISRMSISAIGEYPEIAGEFFFCL